MRRFTVSAAIAISLGPAPAVHAQVRASEPALVAQTVDGTKLTVEYSRPRARTRDSLFGRVVKWGEVWTPGANMATTLEVGKDVKINSHTLAKGKYSVWLVVRPAGQWTAVFDPRPKLFHTQHPDSLANQLRFPVTPGAAPFTEALTWSFSGIKRTGVVLAMEWGTTRVAFDIEVSPSLKLTFPQEQSAPLLGTYSFAWSGGPEASKEIKLFVTWENGRLMGRWDPAPFPEWDRFILINIIGEEFVPGFLEKGELYDVERGMLIKFKMESGKAASFEVRMDEGQVIASGKRLP
ncbi:MAG TPA: DUF2911 domain-containing protein [Gemmatimonadales bacterium]|nr:DUF2911 domain-containing protein [Gemmatimonadales bacterium]